MSSVAFIGLGSNLNNPVSQVELAITNLAKLPKTQLLKSSSLYFSKPQGPQDQPDFVNAVAKVETGLSAQELLTALQEQEQSHGKKKIREWGERIIDLDILLFGEQVIKTANLQIPHPQLSLRDFVLIPLQQVEPSLSIPGHDASLESLILSLPSRFVK